MEKELEIAKQIIKEEIEKGGLKAERIILFGSRARGDYTQESDWDIMVIIKGEFTRQEKRHILATIYRRLAKLKNYYEIILKNEAEFEKMKNIIGSIAYDVNTEGIVI